MHISEASGRDQPLCGAGGGHLLHAAPRGVHRDAADQCPQLRRQVPSQDPHRRAEQHLVSGELLSPIFFQILSWRHIE